MATQHALDFKDNQLGMFIHWGIYSQTGVQEQVFARNNMDRTEYENLAKTFNPVNYDPEQWVLLAKNAGMKYICITTKHHDGFCMWDTKYTDYNIMNTPYGKDVIKMLADACAKHDMQLSFYYSCPDWHHENGFNKFSTHQYKAHYKEDNDYSVYIEYVKNQVTELLTKYGKIYTFFWDIQPRMVDRSINDLVRKLQPDIYINNRGYDEGDFSTPEREYSAFNERKHFPYMTEACNSVGEQSWGYRSNEDFYSFRYLTHAIDKYMSMGANYLLNVGPDSFGVISEEQQNIIKRLGSWYNNVKVSLESAEEDTVQLTIHNNKYNFVTTKKNGKSYIHLYSGIDSSAIAFSVYPNLPKSVKVLNTGKELDFSITTLPEYIMAGNSGIAAQKFLHVRNIPINDLESEAIILEVEW